VLKNIIPIVKTDRFIVEIVISQKCNYECDYCPLNIPGLAHTPLDIDKIMSFSRPGREWGVYIYGGEPTIHPDLFKLLERLGPDRNVLIQSNLSAGKHLLSKITKNHPNVMFAVSYHYKYANFRKFLNKTKMLQESGNLKEIVVMWLSDQDKKISSIYNIFKSIYPDQTWMTPTLPGKYSLLDWRSKPEVHKFLEKYPPSISSFRHEVLVDGVKKTVLEAYADNDDLNIKGINCLISNHRVSYDGDHNVWRTCTADVLYGEISTGICHRSFGCAADLGYEKYHDSDINS
jgi:organic radical activating enzyme